MEERKESVKYRIAEFARMVGVEPSTVRYYEKQGWPSNQRDPNGYRVFSEEDAFRMNMFRSIYSRGFSIREALQMMEFPSRRELIQGLERNSQDMERELLLLEARKQYAEETLQILRLREEGRPMLWRTQLEDHYYLPASILGDFTVTQKNGRTRMAWEENFPFTRFVGVADAKAFAQGEQALIDCGEAVSEKDRERFNYPVDKTVRRLSLGDCLCFFNGSDHPDHMDIREHPAVREYLKEHGLRARGELLYFYLMLYIAEDGEDSGIAALPVEPDK